MYMAIAKVELWHKYWPQQFYAEDKEEQNQQRQKRKASEVVPKVSP